MTPRERLDAMLDGRPVDRPPFFPALYDYKAALAGVPPHLFGQDEASLLRALRLEAAELHAEILTCTYDIYNIEAEALGASLLRVSGLATPELDEPLLHDLDQIHDLPVLTVPAGRMGIFIGAARALAAETGESIPVRGGLSGPFSLASKIYPDEQLLVDTLLDPEKVGRLLAWCNNLVQMYASAFLDAGAHGIAVFDSFIVPPMLSPAAYEEIVLPHHQRLFAFLKAQGAVHRALIAGGNTVPLLPALLKSGANQLLLDDTVPPEQASDILAQYPGMLFRYNLRPTLLCNGSVDDVKKETEKVLTLMQGRKNFILGTGILPAQNPRANILAVREALLAFYA
ncbi:MAG: uroporphyrinogen decarboxylase family protein [Fibrobacterota bacterium]